eukprot:gene2475-13334_t
MQSSKLFKVSSDDYQKTITLQQGMCMIQLGNHE